jgi:hypothetical protein
MTMSHKKITASGIVVNRKCILDGFLVGMDGSNDPTITLYDDNSAATGNEVVPTNTYDSSALGVNGVMFSNDGVRCEKGLYCEITIGGGAVEVTVFYR